MCKLTYFSLKNILNSTCIGRGSEGTVYVDNDQAYKFSNTFLQGSLFSPKPINYVNLDIIGYYNMVKNKVKFTNLPTQLIDYKRVTVGVIYPYYQNYKPFSQLYLENNDLFLTKLYELVRNNIELLENGIFNGDIQNSNVLYNQNDLQIIDLDSKWINKDESYTNNVYYLLMMIKSVIHNKLLELGYNEKEIYKIIEDFNLKYETIIIQKYFDKTLSKMQTIIK